MEAICILEQYRLDPVRAERVAVFTLVWHPFKPDGSREISAEEAREIILARKLRRHEVKAIEDGEENYTVGYCWDTARHAFRNKWSVTGYGRRRRKVVSKNKKFAPIANRKVRNYRKALYAAIDNNLK